MVIEDAYTIKQKVLLDGKQVIPVVGDITYPANYMFSRYELTIPANSADYEIDLSNKGTIKRFSLEDKDSKGDSLTVKINNNSTKVFKINPIYSSTSTPTSLHISNSLNSIKIMEIKFLSA